ncbi:MAG: hypothetical protein MSA91_08360 [Lachnobacterium sp.]|nr:hypothetical protein [Lachnobacterium sp.]MDD6632275.1 hypothetical protein [Lachnobacterium sp.]
MADNEELEEKVDKKKLKEEKKKAKREAREAKKKAKADRDELEDENESTGNKFVLFVVTLLVIVIWLGIIALLIKTDVGGFGSTVLYPYLKDVKYVNKVLPEVSSDADVDTEHQFDSIDDAVNRIKELELQLDEANSSLTTDSETIDSLQSQVDELSTYKEAEAEFEAEKEKFYEEVVFSDQAPDISEYKTYYESIEPENAEVLYKQVVEQLQASQEISDYATTYSSMKPKEAAAIFDTMTDNLSLVADILQAMDAESRANILGKMSADTAAKVTEIMEPDGM